MENNNPLNGTYDLLKKNADLIKGVAAILLGAYLISTKYYIITDFLMLTIGALLLFYGFVCLRFTGLQSFLQQKYFTFGYWYSNGQNKQD